MSLFAVRTVKNGAVTINHHTYKPDEKHMKYDGRLDGLRFAFGTYPDRPDIVCLWGTEKMYNSDSVSTAEGPHIVDGALPWLWWRSDLGL